MATADGPMHLLALKVMRISRPELASAWQPFYSSSPSFSAHSSASILSLQGNTPLAGHPKTLRDFTSASEVLMLPASFGAIQLGETFSSCLCINNETRVGIDVVQFKVEMQTVSSKVGLHETEGLSQNLAGGETLEHVVHHEIKELGQHVLACTLTYRLPPNARPVPGAAEDPSDPALQTFRKFYKFAVTNPLSVKTKVHSVKSPSALFSPTEREKIFLEVHIQNLTQEAIYFERIRLECTDDWDSVDGNMLPVDEETMEPKSIFSKSMALMQPQDMRQYVYILTPKSTKSTTASPVPGSVIPLGRLDMAWRSSFGEPGRLLTSMLSRRIPIPPVQPAQPASAVPQHLKKTFSGNRPHSSSVSSLPGLPQSRPGTPPLGRPGSPAPHRASTSVAIPSSPQVATMPSTSPLPEIDAGILVRYVPRDDIILEKPFSIAFSVTLSSTIPLHREGFRRNITLAIQHLKRRKVVPTAPPPPPEAFTPRLPSSGFSTPSSITATFNYALAHQKIAAATPRPPPSETLVADENTEDDADSLPPPFFEPSSDDATHNIPTVTFVGPSTLYLPKLEMIYSREPDSDTPSTVKANQDFELSFIGLKRGFSCIGGIRVLLVDDQVEEDTNVTEDKATKKIKVQVLKEYETVAEVWVS